MSGYDRRHLPPEELTTKIVDVFQVDPAHRIPIVGQLIDEIIMDVISLKTKISEHAILSVYIHRSRSLPLYGQNTFALLARALGQ
jgi:hypothetical protein